jgi:hypothetical protein
MKNTKVTYFFQIRIRNPVFNLKSMFLKANKINQCYLPSKDSIKDVLISEAGGEHRHQVILSHSSP